MFLHIFLNNDHPNKQTDMMIKNLLLLFLRTGSSDLMHKSPNTMTNIRAIVKIAFFF